MDTLLSRDQVRRVDRLAIEELGIPGIVLMENAGRNAAGVIFDLLCDELALDPAKARVAVLCGGGNNGGDGYVIARHLHNRGVSVRVYTTVDPATLKGDAAVNHTICAKMGLPIERITTAQQVATHAQGWSGAHVVVDALLGTGFRGEVRAHLADVIKRCNALAGPKVVAIDLPSGLDCDTGGPSNATVQADVTVTFVAPKIGFDAPSATRYVGRVVVADIGTPPGLIDRVRASG